MAGMKLIFCIPAHIILSFGFITTTVLVAHQCFCYCCTVSKLFFLFFYPARRPGVRMRSEEHTDRTADPNWPKGNSVPYDDTFSNKSSWKGGRRPFVVRAFVFQSYSYTDWGPDFWEITWQWKVINKFLILLFIYMQIFLNVCNCLYINREIFLPS